MSTEAIHQVITLAITDPVFKSLLFIQPDEALKEYDLSDDEIITLRSISPDEFEAMGGNVEERISRAMGMPSPRTQSCVCFPA